MDYFARHGFEIKDALGAGMEVEQWTTSWARVHQLVPYQRLDEATAGEIAQRLARLIEFLQPMLERALRAQAAAHAHV